MRSSRWTSRKTSAAKCSSSRRKRSASARRSTIIATRQRGGKGVKAFAKEKDIGYVVDQILVNPEDEILLITSGNQVIRIRVAEIRKAGRSTKGVRLQRLEPGDEVIAITNLGAQTKQIEDITGEAPVVS